MKEHFSSEVDLYDDLRNTGMSSNIEDDISSYRPGDSQLDTEVAGTPRRHGRLIQSFRIFSIFGFTSTLLCTWELALSTSYFSLLNGGVSGLVWNYIGSAISMIIVISCLAEMASMTPSSTGLYHWVSEFAPKSVQKYLSYLVGWTSIMAWLSGSAALNFIAGTLIQSLVVLWRPEYQFESWHSTLIVIGIGLFCTLLNTIFNKVLPFVELISFALHFLGIFVVLVPLWVIAPKAMAKDVFVTFRDGGEWKNTGVACLIGQVGTLFALLRIEGGTQISGRIPNAANVIPNSMMTTISVNIILGLLVILTFAFTITTDLSQILAAAHHGYPFIQIYADVTTWGFATASTVLVIILIISASLSTQAIAARQVFTFARDDGLPFSSIWTYMPSSLASTSTSRLVPFNAFCLSFASTVIVALVNLRLEDTLHFVVSVFAAFACTSIFVAIACVLTLRVATPVELPERLWSLGVLTVPVHLLALGYLALMFGMSFFPLSLKGLTFANMNWASLIWALVVGFSTILYVVHAQYVFRAPIWLAGRGLVERNYSRQF